MNKIKTILVLLLMCFLSIAALTFWNIKKKEVFQQKTVLAIEIRKVLKPLIIDLLQAHENTILGIPADGLWYHRLVLAQGRRGKLEYIIKENHLIRAINGTGLVIADNISDLRVRRQKDAPGILEVQIEAKTKVSLISNLRIRIHQ